MRKLNLKKIIIMGLITTSILTIAPVGASASWKQDRLGWWYTNDNGNGGFVRGWMQQNNKWYYFEHNGYMKTGWLSLNNKWYYFNADGAMVTGKVPINGRTSIFDNDGSWTGYTDSTQTSTGTFSREVALDYINNFGYRTYSGVEFNVTSGGYNGFKVNDNIYKIQEYNCRVFGKIDKETGDYVGTLLVSEDGTTMDLQAGDYTNQFDSTFDERQFDAKGTWEPISTTNTTVSKTQEQQDEEEMDRMSNLEYRKGHMDEYNRLVAKYKNK